MDISFVILTWNSGRFIKSCLDSLIVAIEGSGLDCEVFVVDNGSTDDSVEIMKRYTELKPQLFKPIYLDKNHGTTVSRNLALKKVSGRFICIMDSDVEVSSNVFEVLLSVLKSDDNIGMVVPKIYYPSGNWQKSVDRFPTVMHKIHRFFRLREIEKNEGRLETEGYECRSVDYAISAFWMIKKNVINHVGLLDENIFYAPEDVDYCLRVWKSGYKIVYEPKVSVIHHTQEISRGFRLNKSKIYHLIGLAYYFRKHKYIFKYPSI